MKPLAQALDILQSQNGMYIGYLLPVLKTLMDKLEKFNSSSEFIYCQALITAIQQGLNKKVICFINLIKIIFLNKEYLLIKF